MSIDIYANILVECTNLKRVGIGSGKFNFIKLLKISPGQTNKIILETTPIPPNYRSAHANMTLKL